MEELSFVIAWASAWPLVNNLEEIPGTSLKVGFKDPSNPFEFKEPITILITIMIVASANMYWESYYSKYSTYHTIFNSDKNLMQEFIIPIL